MRQICFLLLVLACPLLAGMLNVTVMDPNGGLVAGAAVTAADHTGTTDAKGRTSFPELAAGSYDVSVTKPGFAPWTNRVTVGAQPLDLTVSLKLKAVTTSVHASAGRSPLANSDPNYQLLRNGKPLHVRRISSYVLNRDAGVFTFRSGTFSFLPPVDGRYTVGVFIGDGNFQIKPGGDLAKLRMKRMMGADAVNEDFTALVIYFSDSTFEEIEKHSELVDESPEKHADALKRVRDVIRDRREPHQPGAFPRSEMENLLNYQNIPNYDAEVLAEVYNGAGPGHSGSFRAFIHGNKYGDLRFLVNPHGALPVLNAREEVVLLDFDPNSDSDGLWYLAHTLAEQRAGAIDPHEEKRLIQPEHYKIEALIGDKNILGNQPDLVVACSLSFRPLEDGVRMIKFDLVPDLQVSHVRWNGAEIPFVQESPKHDGSFYLLAPEVLSKDHVYEVSIEYAGGEILQTKFRFVPLTRVWYPTPEGAPSRATYDLIFRIPHGSTIATVGNPVGVSREGESDVMEWATEVPIEHAVFRWLIRPTFKTAVEETTKTRMSLSYVFSGGAIMPPTKDELMIDLGNDVRIMHSWFGKPAYDWVSVVMQNAPTGSLPGLIFTQPALTAGSASVSNQIAMRTGGAAFGALPPQLRPFLDEAFAKRLAEQWWGNTVSPATFHDQWLINGLTDFAGSIYDVETANGIFKDRWVYALDGILVPGRLARIRPNDAGPVWMGLLNNTPPTKGATYELNVSKGAFIIHMLCAMMWDTETGDRDFQNMLSDFVTRFTNRDVSTEDFQSVVNRHTKPSLDLDGNGTMDWFFREWVYGTEVPSYRLEYSLSADAEGRTLLRGRLTQSGVVDSFEMPVPVYADYGSKKGRVCLVKVRGNSTSEFSVTLTTKPKQILLNANHDVLSVKDVAKQVAAGR